MQYNIMVILRAKNRKIHFKNCYSEILGKENKNK